MLHAHPLVTLPLRVRRCILSPPPLCPQLSDEPIETKELTESFGWNKEQAWQQHDIQVRGPRRGKGVGGSPRGTHYTLPPLPPLPPQTHYTLPALPPLPPQTITHYPHYPSYPHNAITGRGG